MPDYRRNRVPGGSYFFTVNLLNRRSNLLVERVADLRAAVRTVKSRNPFHIDAWVVLQDHMHAIWTLPDCDTDFSGRWREIKKAFTKSIPPEEARSNTRSNRGERAIWQHRFWEHTIRDDRDYAAHMDYTHFDPVKHGLVSNPAAWPLSSFHNCVNRGLGFQRQRRRASRRAQPVGRKSAAPSAITTSPKRAPLVFCLERDAI